MSSNCSISDPIIQNSVLWKGSNAGKSVRKENGMTRSKMDGLSYSGDDCTIGKPERTG